jgi:hypothetical protein
MDRPTTLERAFQLARSGKVKTVEEIRSALKREGFGRLDGAGPSLTRQLRKILLSNDRETPSERKSANEPSGSIATAAHVPLV